jgi:hypothetical protein
MKTKYIKNFLLGLCILFIVSMVYASERGLLRVKVIDVEQGKVMSGVPVTITSPVMMGSRTSISNRDGELRFTYLTPGLYTVKAEQEGFKMVVLEKIRISVNVETVVNVQMVITQIQETVTVTGEVVEVETTKATISEYVTADNVESLPVARDFVGYLQLAAGVNVIPNSQGRDTPQDPAGKGGMNYYDRGTRGTGGSGKRGSRDNVYLLDGMDITGLSSQTAQLAFNNEVIQEQELMTSGVPAEYGGGKGVVGNVVSKSGGNKLSGSLNLYLQPKDFYLPYGGAEYNAAKADRMAGGYRDETKLEGYEDNKYDTAFTLGGPVMKDKIWFFLSGQYRHDKNNFNLSRSASATEEEVDYLNKRYSVFGKLTFKLSANDTVNFMYFVDDQAIDGERDNNTVKTQQRSQTFNTGVYSGYYQRVLSDKLLVDFRYGHYWWKWTQGSRYKDAGVPDSVLYLPPCPPIYEYTFGGFTGSVTDDKNTREQFTFNLEWFPGSMRIKAGLQYTVENDLDDEFYEFDQQRSSIDPSLSGITFEEIYDTRLWPRSEFDERLLPYLNNNWGPTSAALDTNGDGVVSRDELRAATFTDMNEHGLNFWRIYQAQRGANKVKALRWAGYIMDDWKINEFFSVNAGVRIENHRYRNSEGGVIFNMDTVFLPRLGVIWDIGAKGNHKLTAFYGHFSDPIPLGMIHFAGNIPGRITHEQVWLNGDWYTYRVRGSEEHRDTVWTPNTKDSYSREASITHEIDLGKGLVITTQAYIRQDRKLIEDYDLFNYVMHFAGDPTWGHLALTYEDFGYPETGPPGEPNYFLSNLIGAKRDIFGIDFELAKRFKNGSNLVFQYSYKFAKGNSQSDGNADLQGDFIELDPRNPWMLGPTPGTIPHKIKIYGTYRTSFGLDIGALFYWNTGWRFTESYIYLPGRYNIYYNWDEGKNQFVKTGQEQTPSYYQVDLKFNYRLKLSERLFLDLFLDIYNVTNNQAPFDVQYGHNDPMWNYKETTEILLPMRFYLGVRLRF